MHIIKTGERFDVEVENKNGIKMKWNAMAQLIRNKKFAANHTNEWLYEETYLKTYASIWSFRLKLIISHRTDFNKASHIDLHSKQK